MRIFTRYILGEVLSHALLGGALFTFVLFMKYLGPILELVVRNSASLHDVVSIIAYMLPNTLTVTIPMAVLVGILLGLSRLASDSEITAMRACGMGVFSFVRVVALVAIAGWMLGLFNSMYLAPRAATSLLALEDSLKGSQASFEVQPRVFYPDFRNYVLYVQDVRPAAGAAVWRHVFLADLTEPGTPHITTAASAVAVNGENQTLRLHLIDATEHVISSTEADGYHISTFGTTDLPIQTGTPEDTHIGRSDMPMQALGMRALWNASRQPTGLPYRIELNQRFSYPVACLVLMLVGVPLGLYRRGGKGTGFVLTIVLVFLYYLLSTVGMALARQQKISVVLGVWGANIVFTVAGLLLLQQMSSGGIALSVFSSLGMGLNKIAGRLLRREEQPGRPRTLAGVMQRMRRGLRSRFPLILDEYVMREFLRNFALILTSFAMLFLIFTFFELIGDIVRNRTPLVTVGDYMLNLVPFILYHVTPLCSLVAVLVTFGSLERSSEITAMKATGISLYRIITPVLLVAAMLAAALFAFDESYLPAANRRQEQLRAIIKGKPAQTFLAGREWMSGQMASNGEPSRIFYYQAFDAQNNVFANLTVFEFQPDTFVLQRRIFAQSARWDDKVDQWVFENGWLRTFAGDAVAGYQPFKLSTFPEIHEQPGYFTKEYRQSQEMSYGELSRYIADLRQSGFDTIPLRVQLNSKLADPLITLIMAVLAIPFSLSMGKRGGLAGMATAIGLAITYWVVQGLFQNLGNINSLPPLLAAWSPDLLFTMAGGYLLLRTPT